MKTVYKNLSELGESQVVIMNYINVWVHTRKTTVPLQDIIKEMQIKGINKNTTVKSLKGLLNKGYIRKSFEAGREVKFVQLRTV